MNVPSPADAGAISPTDAVEAEFRLGRTLGVSAVPTFVADAGTGRIHGITAVAKDAGEIAAAAVYLASPAGSYLTGKTLEVDGGITFPNLDLPLPDL